MKKYKVIALSALIAAGFTSCDLTEKPTSYYEKDTYFETMDQAKMSVVGIYDCLAIDKHYGQYENGDACFGRYLLYSRNRYG